ncbi:MAG: MFS transporter [Chitinophagaceae bacterium]
MYAYLCDDLRYFFRIIGSFSYAYKTVYGVFPDAPDPLKYAFYGPLIGSLVRVLFGPVADKIGGAILTQITGIALIICCGLIISMGLRAPTSIDQFSMFLVIMFIMFFFSGVGNAVTFRQYPIIFSDSPRRAAGVIGFTASIAAYGLFLFNVFIDHCQQSRGNANAFFIGLLILCVFATIINWWYYSKKGCERPS